VLQQRHKRKGTQGYQTALRIKKDNENRDTDRDTNRDAGKSNPAPATPQGDARTTGPTYQASI
jgi:hypothetical protein